MAEHRNKGVVLEFEPLQRLAYTHLSSISELADREENYTVIEFGLKAGAELTIGIRNFPTDEIYHHMAFYWNVAPELLKKFVENNIIKRYI
jgi:hypothetical protein